MHLDLPHEAPPVVGRGRVDHRGRVHGELAVALPTHSRTQNRTSTPSLMEKRIVVQVQYVPRCLVLVESQKFRGASCGESTNKQV